MKKNILSSILLFTLISISAICQPELLDGTFGVDGKQAETLPKGFDIVEEVNVLSNGKIIIGGSSFYDGSYRFSFAQYNPDGTLDENFGFNGTNAALLPPDFSGDGLLAMQIILLDIF